MKWIRGDRLNPATRSDVLRRFIYRMTAESIAQYPDIAARMRIGGYRMPILSDADWLKTKAFAVKANGTLDNRERFCGPSFLAD
jgi:hypothetical protein